MTQAVAFRCDGDDRIGAGHVARCLRIALALEEREAECVFVGEYAGVARALLDEAGVRREAPSRGPAGVGEGARAVVVDSYAIAPGEVAELAAAMPTTFVSDGPPAPPGAALLAYHLDAGERIDPPRDAPAWLGPDFAPVRPAFVASRRARRGLEHVLITIGGGRTGAELIERLVAGLATRSDADFYVAADWQAGHLPEAIRSRVASGLVPGGLAEKAVWADAAVSGAGSTPYELACAGTPALLLALADNQLPVATAFQRSGIAAALDAREPVTADALRAALEQLLDDDQRVAQALAGPRLVDGYGSFRAADALLAHLDGRPAPRVLRYRPAESGDAELLLRWRNDPDVRAASRNTEPVPLPDHQRWLRTVLEDDSRVLLVVEDGGVPAATLRFDLEGSSAEISVTVDPDRRGSGVGTQATREAAELMLAAHAALSRVRACVREANATSVAAFERAGYRRAGDPDADGMLALELTRKG